MKNVLFVISGPSGVGKGTIVKEILSSCPILPSVSCTTRAPRPGEVNGKDYFFLSKEEFLSRVEEDGFLEYDEHFGNFYGTPKAFVEERLKESSVLLEIDVLGALNAKKWREDAYLILIAPPSKEELKSRLSGRGTESEEAISSRIERMEFELSKASLFDSVVVNDNLSRAVEEVRNIILSQIQKESE